MEEEWLQQVFDETMEDIVTANLQPGESISIGPSGRMSRSLGRTRYVPGENRFEIKITKRILSDKKYERILRDTVAHEILHTVQGCMNHGTNWKRAAYMLMKAFPSYTIRTTADLKQYGLEELYQKRKAAYVFRCSGCGQEIRRMRAGRFTKNYREYRCGRCQGRFYPVYPGREKSSGLSL